MISFTIPKMRLVNSLNERKHWSKKAERAAIQRAAARALTFRELLGGPEMSAPYDAVIVRIGPGTMDKGGLWAAVKHIEDGVCDALGVNDGNDAQWRLEVRQEKPAKGAKDKDRYGVRVEIRCRQ
jgi:hypothetical protein